MAIEGGDSCFGNRSRGTRSPAIVYLWLFPWVGALGVYSINLRLYAYSPGRSVSFASLFVIILHHERVI